MFHIHRVQQMQPKDKAFSHEITGKPWNIVDADVLILNNSYLLCIVDYYITFYIVKRMSVGRTTYKVLQDSIY